MFRAKFLQDGSQRFAEDAAEFRKDAEGGLFPGIGALGDGQDGYIPVSGFTRIGGADAARGDGVFENAVSVGTVVE